MSFKLSDCTFVEALFKIRIIKEKHLSYVLREIAICKCKLQITLIKTNNANFLYNKKNIETFFYNYTKSRNWYLIYISSNTSNLSNASIYIILCWLSILTVHKFDRFSCIQLRLDPAPNYMDLVLSKSTHE